MASDWGKKHTQRMMPAADQRYIRLCTHVVTRTRWELRELGWRSRANPARHMEKHLTRRPSVDYPGVITSRNHQRVKVASVARKRNNRINPFSCLGNGRHYFAPTRVVQTGELAGGSNAAGVTLRPWALFLSCDNAALSSGSILLEVAKIALEARAWNQPRPSFSLASSPPRRASSAPGDRSESGMAANHRLAYPPRRRMMAWGFQV